MKKKNDLNISAEECLKRAEVLFDLGDEAEALEYYRMGVKDGGKSANAFFRLAVCVEDEKPEQAIKYYLKALRIDSKHSEACYGLGRIYGKTGRLDKAVSCFKRVVKLDPKDGKGYCGLGLALSHKKKFEEAVANIKKAVELDPSDSVSYRIYAMILENKGYLKGALEKYRQSADLSKNPQVERKIVELSALIEGEGG